MVWVAYLHVFIAKGNLVGAFEECMDRVFVARHSIPTPKAMLTKASMPILCLLAMNSKLVEQVFELRTPLQSGDGSRWQRRTYFFFSA